MFADLEREDVVNRSVIKCAGHSFSVSIKRSTFAECDPIQHHSSLWESLPDKVRKILTALTRATNCSCGDWSKKSRAMELSVSKQRTDWYR
jgi:hypothetical protein